MVTHKATVLTPHGHCHSNYTHPTWPLSHSNCTCPTWPLSQQLHSPHMATHTATALTPHGHSHSCCSHPTWSPIKHLFSPHMATVTQQLYSPHMANHLSVLLTTHGHSHSNCTHHTWPLTQQLYSPHMATHTATVFTIYGHSLSNCPHHTWPLIQQPCSPYIVTYSAAVLNTHGHSLINCTHYTWPIAQWLYSPHMATHTTIVLPTHGHSHSNCAHHKWPLTPEQYSPHTWLLKLYAPHMATHTMTVLTHMATPAVFTTHGYSHNDGTYTHGHSSCMHHTWLLTQWRYLHTWPLKLYAPHMATHTMTVLTHMATQAVCTTHGYSHNDGTYTHGHSSCMHHTWLLTQWRYLHTWPLKLYAPHMATHTMTVLTHMATQAVCTTHGYSHNDGTYTHGHSSCMHHTWLLTQWRYLHTWPLKLYAPHMATRTMTVLTHMATQAVCTTHGYSHNDGTYTHGHSSCMHHTWLLAQWRYLHTWPLKLYAPHMATRTMTVLTHMATQAVCTTHGYSHNDGTYTHGHSSCMHHTWLLAQWRYLHTWPLKLYSPPGLRSNTFRQIQISFSPEFQIHMQWQKLEQIQIWIQPTKYKYNTD